MLLTRKAFLHHFKHTGEAVFAESLQELNNLYDLYNSMRSGPDRQE